MSKKTQEEAEQLQIESKDEFNKYNEKGPLNDIDLTEGFTKLKNSF